MNAAQFGNGDACGQCVQVDDEPSLTGEYNLPRNFIPCFGS